MAEGQVTGHDPASPGDTPRSCDRKYSLHAWDDADSPSTGGSVSRWGHQDALLAGPPSSHLAVDAACDRVEQSLAGGGENDTGVAFSALSWLWASLGDEARLERCLHRSTLPRLLRRFLGPATAADTVHCTAFRVSLDSVDRALRATLEGRICAETSPTGLTRRRARARAQARADALVQVDQLRRRRRRRSTDGSGRARDRWTAGIQLAERALEWCLCTYPHASRLNFSTNRVPGALVRRVAASPGAWAQLARSLRLLSQLVGSSSQGRRAVAAAGGVHAAAAVALAASGALREYEATGRSPRAGPQDAAAAAADLLSRVLDPALDAPHSNGDGARRDAWAAKLVAAWGGSQAEAALCPALRTSDELAAVLRRVTRPLEALLAPDDVEAMLAAPDAAAARGPLCTLIQRAASDAQASLDPAPLLGAMWPLLDAEAEQGGPQGCSDSAGAAAMWMTALAELCWSEDAAARVAAGAAVLVARLMARHAWSLPSAAAGSELLRRCLFSAGADTRLVCAARGQDLRLALDAAAQCAAEAARLASGGEGRGNAVGLAARTLRESVRARLYLVRDGAAQCVQDAEAALRVLCAPQCGTQLAWECVRLCSRSVGDAGASASEELIVAAEEVLQNAALRGREGEEGSHGVALASACDELASVVERATEG